MHDTANELRRRLIARVLDGDANADRAQRRAAFDNRDVDARASALIAKVSATAWKVTSDDVAASKAAGVTEDEIFELTVCAAIGQATRQLDAALAVVDQALTSTPTPDGDAR